MAVPALHEKSEQDFQTDEVIGIMVLSSQSLFSNTIPNLE